MHPAPDRVRCSVTLSASREGNAIAELLGEADDVTVTVYPAFIRVESSDLLRFDLGVIAERLGQAAFTAYDLQVELSSSCGRLVALDDEVVVYGNAEDAAEHLGLRPVT